MRPLLTLAISSLKNRLGTVILTMLAIALSTLLFLGIEKTRSGTKASFEATIVGTDLIVGARSAPVNLLMASVFRIGDPPANISWQTAREIAARPDIAWTVPLSLGDSYRGRRVLGTNETYFEHYRYGDNSPLMFEEGQQFSDLFDVVLGAEVARTLGLKMGDELELTHGLGQAGISDHDHKPFKVVGILSATGTPVDHTLHISLEAVRAIHVGWETGAQSRIAREVTQDDLRRLDLAPESISAMLVGLENRTSVLRTKRALDTYPDEALLAVLPGQAMSDLWAITGSAERAMLAISVFAILIGLISALVSLLSGLNERRREMAILRAVGARPHHIAGLLVTEATLIGGVAAFIGIASTHLGLMILGPLLRDRLGIVLVGTGPGSFDLMVFAVVTLASSAVGIVPAILAYRRVLADGLTVKL